MRLAATLAAGLPGNSRSKMLQRRECATTDQLLLAVIADDLNLLCWKLSGAGTQPPHSIYNALQGIAAPEEENGVQSFASAEDFEAAFRTMQGGEENGN